MSQNNSDQKEMFVFSNWFLSLYRRNYLLHCLSAVSCEDALLGLVRERERYGELITFML